MPFLNCNILQDASVTELFQACLVVSLTLGEVALVQMFSCYARDKCGSQFSLVACEDCLEVCSVRLVGERICVWCLAIVVIFMISRSKKVWGMLKSHQFLTASIFLIQAPLPIQSYKNTFIAIENTYLNGVFLKSKISIFS